MTDQEFIKKFLDINQPIELLPTRFSTVGLLLRGARKMSGRDLTSGDYVMNELTEENFREQTYHSHQFSGLINYLIFLEQIGSIFKFPSTKTNGIHIALEKFSALSEQQIFAVRALRNSLAHDFGLATEIIPQNVNKRHKFSLSIERNRETIKLPIVRWEGNFDDKTDETNTTVFIIDLCDLIEDVYFKLKEEVLNDNTELNLSGGLNELKGRFTITY